MADLIHTAKLPLANLQQSPQQNPMIPVMQECVDAITEHQRLHALMKGEWAKGLLPHSNVREDYMVQRIQGMNLKRVTIYAYHPFCICIYLLKQATIYYASYTQASCLWSFNRTCRRNLLEEF